MMRSILSLLAMTLSLLNIFSAQAADQNRSVKSVHFDKGASSTVINDSIRGRQYIDYQLQASAGQTITVSIDGSNAANYFNLLPPDSTDVAMAMGDISENHFQGVLPDDGLYTIRVYLMRSAARRNETSRFTLNVGVTGKPLPPVSPKTDAVLPGTHYHAKTAVKCTPQYSQARECEAFVIRRGFDGTATVEVRWDKNGKRRILFVKGKPIAADAPQAMTFTKSARDDFLVGFDGDEHYEIPAALIYGG